MRYSLLGLALLSSLAIAEPAKDTLSQARFEERFHAADKNKDGKLSRTEANAEFPRAPEFFDQIDSNKDNFVTLVEVKRAVDRYVKTTLASSKPGSKYVQPQDLKGEPLPAGSTATPEAAFASKAEASRQHRYDYYEALAESQETTRGRGEPTQPEPYPSIFKKGF